MMDKKLIEKAPALKDLSKRKSGAKVNLDSSGTAVNLEVQPSEQQQAAKPKGAGTKRSAQGPAEKPRAKKRFAWSPDLHRHFMGALFDIGLASAKPKAIMAALSDNAPDELTTEHIKSHLQKYRNNSKKSRDAFMAQFKIAKDQVEMCNDGKALHPSFHAYPLPIGDHPIYFDNKRSKTNKASQKQVQPTPQNSHPRHDANAARQETEYEAYSQHHANQMELQMQMHGRIHKQHEYSHIRAINDSNARAPPAEMAFLSSSSSSSSRDGARAATAATTPYGQDVQPFRPVSASRNTPGNTPVAISDFGQNSLYDDFFDLSAGQKFSTAAPLTVDEVAVGNRYQFSSIDEEEDIFDFLG